LFPSRNFEHKSIDDVVKFIEKATFKKIYNEIYRLRNNKRQMFTKNDIKFNEEYNSLVSQSVYKMTDDGKIVFPLIEKEVQSLEVPEGYKSQKDYLKKIQKDFEKLANFSQIYENLQESEEQPDEDEIQDEENPEEEHEWQKREKQVADNIDSAIKEFESGKNI